MFRNRAVVLLSLLLATQALAFYAVPRTEVDFSVRPLGAFPAKIGDWVVARTFPMEQSVQDVLKSDDSVSRLYVTPAGQAASLFIAFFKSQRAGVAPHSPKNCLPGSGWAPLQSGFETIEVPGHAPITVNRYVVARADERTIVYYWYQSAHRAVASEYKAKVWLVLDSIRYRRSDTSLVRIIVPTPPGGNVEESDRQARAFIAQAYPQVVSYLPH